MYKEYFIMSIQFPNKTINQNKLNVLNVFKLLKQRQNILKWYYVYKILKKKNVW